MNNRHKPLDDFWGNIISEIVLDEEIPEHAFKRITDFSHLEIIYYFDQAKEDHIPYSRRPRGNPDFPEMGVFAQRNKDRPIPSVSARWNLYGIAIDRSV